MIIKGNLGDLVRQRVEQTKQNLEKTVTASIFELTQRVVKRSPVDTGRFRANWLPSARMPRKQIIYDEIKDFNQVANRALPEIIKAVRSGQSFFLVNNLPYAKVIEYGLYPNPVKLGTKNPKTKVYEIRSTGGFSKQAPSGVVRITVREYQLILKRKILKNRSK